MKEHNHFSSGPKGFATPTPSHPSRPSIRDMLDKVKAQVEFDTFGYRDKILAEELCSIIAEIYWLSERTNGSICVEGVQIPYVLVKEIYESLGAAHMEYVIDYYRGATHTIRNAKAYLRVALYNSVFKLELTRENEFRSDT